MKKIFTPGCCAIAITILLFNIAFSASAQYTSKVITANAYASAIAKDNSGNIYVMEAINHTSSSNAQILKYTNGTGTPAVIYNGSLILDLVPGYVDNYAFGLAVTSNGDIYATTANDYGNSVYGNIIKLTNNSGTYTGSVFKAGNTNNGAFSALAVDANDNLYCVEYNVAGNGGLLTNGVPGAYEVVKYPATGGIPSTSGSTVLYSKLGLLGFASANTYSTITSLVVDASGNVYVGDNFNNGTLPSPDGGHVYKLTKSGSTYTPSTFSTNTFTEALSIDASGNLYAFTGNNSDPKFTLVEYVGATGAPVTLVPTGTFTAAGGWYPYGLIALNKNNLFAINGTQLGDFMQLTGPPTTQATNVNFTNVLGTTATANWTNGNGSTRAVFIKQTTTGNPTPVNNTTYGANVNFGSGTQIAATGWYCIYNGTGTSVNITGLTSGQTYRVMVLEYNGPAGGENYLQSTATNNPNNVSPLALTTINTINRVTAATTNAASVSYTATFGASVTGLSTTNFSLATTGTISGASVSSVVGSGTTYTVAVNTGTGDGTITLNLANATGLTPGLTTTLPFAGQAYTIDKTAPTVVISSTATSPTSITPIPIKLTFSESVSGFTAANVSVSPGTVANFSGSGNVYNFDINTGSFTTYTVNIAAGQVTDLAGNTNSIAASFTIVFTTPLAVQLIDFTATEKSNGAVYLDWKIASEQNNDHYLLEKSTDGSVFTTLHISQAQLGGNSSTELDYNFTDNNPIAGNNSYRLTQVDKDGRSKLLGIRVVKVVGKGTDWSVYPNPAPTHFSIALPNEQTGKKVVSIFDAAGKLVYSKQIISNAGKLDIQLEKALSKGIYTLQVEGLGARNVYFK